MTINEEIETDQIEAGEPKEEETEESGKFSKKKIKKYETRIRELEEKLQKLENNSKKETIDLQAESNAWKNKFYEAYADLDNTRKVLNKDHEDMIKYRAMGFVEKLLPLLDNFEMAFKTVSDDPKIKNYQVGFQMIYRQMVSILKEEGVTLIEPDIGVEFDHRTMAAMSTVKGETDNLVSSLFLKGYMLKDRLVRPAMVVVTKVEEENDEKLEETSGEAAQENKGE